MSEPVITPEQEWTIVCWLGDYDAKDLDGLLRTKIEVTWGCSFHSHYKTLQEIPPEQLDLHVENIKRLLAERHPEAPTRKADEE